MGTSAIYFVNEEHELNFERVRLKWAVEKDNTEYMSACYILATPLIFNKISEYLHTFDKPVGWIWRWEYKYTLSKLQDEDDNDEREEIEIPYDLSSSMEQLGKLSLNLWNSYEHFNLMHCLGTVDEKHYEVVKCAIKMRMGEFK